MNVWLRLTGFTCNCFGKPEKLHKINYNAERLGIQNVFSIKKFMQK